MKVECHATDPFQSTDGLSTSHTLNFNLYVYVDKEQQQLKDELSIHIYSCLVAAYRVEPLH